MATTEVISSNNPEAAKKAAEILNRGGVILYPTETLYGIGALATNGDAVERIFEAKGRPHGKPIPVLVKNTEMLTQIARSTPLSTSIAEKYWPGKLTILFELTAELPELITCGSGKIAIRISSHAFLQELFELINEPLTSTSANISDGLNISDPKELLETFGGKVDLIVDSGNIPASKGSTIIDLTLDPPQILRDGDVDSKTLKEFINGHS